MRRGGILVQLEPTSRRIEPDEPAPPAERARPSKAALLALALGLDAALAALLFGLAGRIDLPWFWATLAVVVVSHVAMMLTIFGRDPELLRERVHGGPGVPLWDRVLMRALAAIALADLSAAALDGRFRVSDTIPDAARIVGLWAVAIGFGIIARAMKANTFFSRDVRIQRERGHRVVRSGPYSVVRHPGYLGWILAWTGLLLALGSWIGVALAAVVAALVVVRAALEDRFLRRELAGYDAYAREVRWRLVPGLW